METTYRRFLLHQPGRSRRRRKRSEDVNGPRRWWPNIGGNELLAIKLMRTGAKKRPSYRVVVKEKQSKRDGAYLENLGTYDPTRNPAAIKLDMDRVGYWLEKGAQPTLTVSRLIKQSKRAAAAATS
jgi:small subunit ribosomal protein S16